MTTMNDIHTISPEALQGLGGGKLAYVKTIRSEDVQKFFSTYYVASNASLVVVGDFDPAEIKPYIASVFGTLPRGNDVTRKEIPLVGWKGAKQVTMTDTVKFPKVILSWHSAAAYQPERANKSIDRLLRDPNVVATTAGRRTCWAYSSATCAGRRTC